MQHQSKILKTRDQDFYGADRDHVEAGMADYDNQSALIDQEVGLIRANGWFSPYFSRHL